ncbi:uncharacterized protein N7479_004627 [Penicillium vulpinum]|uniref:Uncharacterized protein n=1 Tax=Penicillium vulpinum TaxID=29845 RepID=A0A1V6RMZ2_9EURO|nr:uncharacterized protein N7479_004627 [Penicillium vulpinum]KAJ5964751.1 hypothetical protein N7479_004627 [Penicillium vulpinum]OQE02809.1 hypothetical protein PENVUL_c038G03814 [Penicillium vulpinum]
MAQNLHHFVDPDQEMLLSNDPNITLWLKLSLLVRAWLCRCVARNLEQEVSVAFPKLWYANDFMKEIKYIMEKRRFGNTKRACFEIWDARLEDFSTIDEFVAALKQRLHTAIDLEANVLPYML